MPLIQLWKSNSVAINEFTIEQIVSTSGDGKLRDNSLCSNELREYLSQISSDKISEYINYCLTNSFSKSGIVLQDLVNELGRRLDYNVTNGLYQGSQNKIGFDGIWAAPESNQIIIEVKTTDAYRISLDTLMNYKKGLIKNSEISEDCSILIVVGREDTGELEAQVRGSRHAWDIRLISTDALINLVKLKESSEELETAQKIRSILIPMEYTKLDDMIDVMFTTAKDVETSSEEQVLLDKQEESKSEEEKQWHFTDSKVLQTKRELIVAAVGKLNDCSYIKKTRALYWDSNHKNRIACTMSKRYELTNETPYWYAYHPKWDEFLTQGEGAFFVLGCMDLEIAFAIPHSIIKENIENFHTTVKDNNERMYWHIKIRDDEKGNYYLLLPKISEALLINQYSLKLLGN